MSAQAALLPRLLALTFDKVLPTLEYCSAAWLLYHTIIRA